MILSDKTIESIKDLISPFNKNNLQPASMDLTLKEIMRNGVKSDKAFEILKPKEFILASTNEIVNVPDNLVGIVSGKSSLARMGLAIHDAGFIDPGFSGQITLELFNKSNKAITLKKDMPICQIYFVKTDAPVENSYNGHYQNQKGVTGSWMENS